MFRYQEGRQVYVTAELKSRNSVVTSFSGKILRQAIYILCSISLQVSWTYTQKSCQTNLLVLISWSVYHVTLAGWQVLVLIYQDV